MENKDKTVIVVILAILAVFACAAVSCCAVLFYTVSRMDRNTLSEVLHDSFTVSADTPETAGETETDEEPLTETGLSPDELKIINATENVRGLSAEEKFAPIYQTEDELRAYLIDQLDEVSDEDFENELGLYNILGFAPEDFDLRQYYVDMYSEQIAGFYDPETNEMYLIDGASPYDNALTLAHEYTHYLQYNNPDFAQTLQYEDDFCTDNPETCLIIDALVEGDASLTENLIDPESILGHSPQVSTSSSSVYDSAPKYFQDSLLFPYVKGFDFVAHYYMLGGFDAVNRLFVELPQSIEQILHPEKYLKDLPVDVSLEPFRTMIADQYEIEAENVLNESDIMMIWGSGYQEAWRLSERQIAVGANGWGGGSYLYAEEDGQQVFFTKVVWDSVTDAEEAEINFRLYSDLRFGQQIGEQIWSGEKGGTVHLIRQQDALYWMIFPEGFNADPIISMIKNASEL